MLMTAYQLGFGNASIKATIELTDNSVDAAGLTTYTFSSQALGAADTHRQIMVAIHGHAGSNNAAITSVSIGGVSASSIVAVGGGGGHRAEIWSAVVPTGTTGDVVVVFPAVKGNCGIGVYRVMGARTTSDNTNTNTDDPMVATINTVGGGIVIAIAGDVSTSTYTWTNLTERYDEVQDGATSHTGASDAFFITETGRSITCNPSSTAVEEGMVVAAWAPV